MMSDYERVQSELRARSGRWLVTGCAGFIGSHLVEQLLTLDQDVVGLDDLSAGTREAVTQIEFLVAPEQWARFEFIRGDIRDPEVCLRACAGADYVLHHAALASVPQSIRDPLAAHECNVSGFLNLMVAARDSGVKGFVFASSSAVYGDHELLPTPESLQGAPLSPYAATKRADELYAAAFSAVYGFPSVALRYFNCFGGRQRIDGPYASVIPIWLNAILDNRRIVIHGDGSTTRDYVHIDDVIQANLLASMHDVDGEAKILNIGTGVRTRLDDLHSCMKRVAGASGIRYDHRPQHKPVRAGDILHSCADISKAVADLGYSPRVGLEEGLETMLGAMTGDASDLRQVK